MEKGSKKIFIHIRIQKRCPISSVNRENTQIKSTKEIPWWSSDECNGPGLIPGQAIRSISHRAKKETETHTHTERQHTSHRVVEHLNEMNVVM